MKTQNDFKTKKEFFHYLKENKKELIDLKKAQCRFTDPFVFKEAITATKGLSSNFKDDLEAGIITRTIIGNTYNWMDSYSDVLVNGCAERTLQARQDMIKHLHDHQMMLTAKVGNPISVYEKTLSWKQLGVNIEGRTMALFMDSQIKKSYNEFIYNQYLAGEIDQHSIGFFYVDLSLAVNDESADFEDEYKVYKKYIDRIGNKELADAQGYFWAVTEIKLLEISAVILGANELTPTIPNESKLIVENPKTEKVKEKTIYSIIAS